ncbi:hypothetical protein K491DRAFT_750590 [Lophiostoma macrostomum CBS 122681]|uniref:Uncharacterized protein n=1 Tax=Lophiostoma macrostomum CBS 122681 TaxID=1314788 RepID=A0A6A6T1L3_9PLEO|nr:hypothetical protein K491DRAFT_750590 [Lophiostoma macrostomum CBS 122681]
MLFPQTSLAVLCASALTASAHPSNDGAPPGGFKQPALGFCADPNFANCTETTYYKINECRPYHGQFAWSEVTKERWTFPLQPNAHFIHKKRATKMETNKTPRTEKPVESQTLGHIIIEPRAGLRAKTTARSEKQLENNSVVTAATAPEMRRPLRYQPVQYLPLPGEYYDHHALAKLFRLIDGKFCVHCLKSPLHGSCGAPCGACGTNEHQGKYSRMLYCPEQWWEAQGHDPPNDVQIYPSRKVKDELANRGLINHRSLGDKDPLLLEWDHPAMENFYWGFSMPKLLQVRKAQVGSSRVNEPDPGQQSSVYSGRSHMTPYMAAVTSGHSRFQDGDALGEEADGSDRLSEEDLTTTFDDRHRHPKTYAFTMELKNPDLRMTETPKISAAAPTASASTVLRSPPERHLPPSGPYYDQPILNSIIAQPDGTYCVVCLEPRHVSPGADPVKCCKKRCGVCQKVDHQGKACPMIYCVHAWWTTQGHKPGPGIPLRPRREQTRQLEHMGILHPVQSYFETIMPVMNHPTVRAFYAGKEPPSPLMSRQSKTEDKSAHGSSITLARTTANTEATSSEVCINKPHSIPTPTTELDETPQRYPQSDRKEHSTVDKPCAARNLSTSPGIDEEFDRAGNNASGYSLTARQQSVTSANNYRTPAPTMSPERSHIDHTQCEQRIQQLEDEVIEQRRQSLQREHDLQQKNILQENEIMMKDREI